MPPEAALDALGLGIVLDRDRAVLGVVSRRDGLLDVRAVEAPAGWPASRRAEVLARAAAVLRQRAAHSVTALGLALPDPRGIGAHHHDISTDSALVDLVAGACALPARAADLGACLALGEARHGAGRAGGDFLVVHLGAAVAAGAWIGGAPWRWRQGGLGLAHLCVEPAGRCCACGARGCLCQYASHGALERLAHELELPRVRPAASGWASGIEADLAARALAGDRQAAALLDEAAEAAARAIAVSVQLLGPTRVLLSAGRREAFAALGPRVAEALAALLPACPIELCEAGAAHEVAITGAAELLTLD